MFHTLATEHFIEGNSLVHLEVVGTAYVLVLTTTLIVIYYFAFTVTVDGNNAIVFNGAIKNVAFF